MFGNTGSSDSIQNTSNGTVANATFPSVAEPPSPPPVAGANNSGVNPNTNVQNQTANTQSQSSDLQAQSSAQQAKQIEPSLEFKKGPFDEPDDITDGVSNDVDNTVAPNDSPVKTSIEMSDDEKTKALRKSLGLDKADVKQDPVTKSADEATFPTISQMDQASGVGVSPLPATDDKKDEVGVLEKLMDEIVWDLAGIQAKIRQLKDKIGENNSNPAPSVTVENVALKKPDVKEEKKEPEKPPEENPLAGYKI